MTEKNTHIINDAELDLRVKRSVAIELERRKAMRAPIVRYNRDTGEIFHEMSDGELVKVGSRSKRGRYSERKK